MSFDASPFPFISLTSLTVVIRNDDVKHGNCIFIRLVVCVYLNQIAFVCFLDNYLQYKHIITRDGMDIMFV